MAPRLDMLLEPITPRLLEGGLDYKGCPRKRSISLGT